MAIPEHSAFRLRIGINRRFAATPGEDNYTKQGILWPDMGSGSYSPPLGANRKTRESRKYPLTF